MSTSTTSIKLNKLLQSINFRLSAYLLEAFFKSMSGTGWSVWFSQFCLHPYHELSSTSNHITYNNLILHLLETIHWCLSRYIYEKRLSSKHIFLFVEKRRERKGVVSDIVQQLTLRDNFENNHNLIIRKQHWKPRAIMYMTLKYDGDHHKHDNIGSYTSMPVQAELHIILS